MTKLDIDAIEARLKDEVTESGDELELIGIYFSTEEARGLCAEVRELRAALERVEAAVKVMETTRDIHGKYLEGRETIVAAIEMLRAALKGDK